MLPAVFFQDIDGKDTQMSKFKGKVCLVVNLASKCGPSWGWPGWLLYAYAL
jgi:glutathione peroxidase-family protein